MLKILVNHTIAPSPAPYGPPSAQPSPITTSSVSPSPVGGGGKLPQTGPDVTVLVVIAAAVLIAGMAIVFGMQRYRGESR